MLLTKGRNEIEREREDERDEREIQKIKKEKSSEKRRDGQGIKSLVVDVMCVDGWNHRERI